MFHSCHLLTFNTFFSNCPLLWKSNNFKNFHELPWKMPLYCRVWIICLHLICLYRLYVILVAYLVTLMCPYCSCTWFCCSCFHNSFKKVLLHILILWLQFDAFIPLYLNIFIYSIFLSWYLLSRMVEEVFFGYNSLFSWNFFKFRILLLGGLKGMKEILNI